MSAGSARAKPEESSLKNGWKRFRFGKHGLCSDVNLRQLSKTGAYVNLCCIEKGTVTLSAGAVPQSKDIRDQVEYLSIILSIPESEMHFFWKCVQTFLDSHPDI